MIEINNLNYGYTKKNKLYSNLSLNISQGNIVGLLGNNGAGKSTLLKLISGILLNKQESISTLGVNPDSRYAEMMEEIFFISEEIEFEKISIKKYVKATTPFYKRFDKKLFNSILNTFEINENMVLTKISYGQKKKFLIALGLASNCRLLIFDEPTNGLDINSKKLFRQVMTGYLKENQLAIISTHQVKDIENIVDELVIINNGKIALHENVFNLTNQYNFKKVIKLTNNEVYSEEIPGGYNVINKKETEEITDLDIELFFNAIQEKIDL